LLKTIFLNFIIVIWIVMYDRTLCDQVCAWLATGRWFSPGTPGSSTNTMDRHDRNEILLIVSFNTIIWTFVLMSISELVTPLRVMENRISENVENLKINPQTFEISTWCFSTPHTTMVQIQLWICDSNVNNICRALKM
jgi:hypothetical protein